MMKRLLMLMLLAGCVSNDCDAGRYKPPQQINIDRPVSIVIVDEFPQGIVGCEPNGWACAPNAFGNGRAVIYVKPDHLACVYHELAHTGGWNHE